MDHWSLRHARKDSLILFQNINTEPKDTSLHKVEVSRKYLNYLRLPGLTITLIVFYSPDFYSNLLTSSWPINTASLSSIEQLPRLCESDTVFDD